MDRARGLAVVGQCRSVIGAELPGGGFNGTVRWSVEVKARI